MFVVGWRQEDEQVAVKYGRRLTLKGNAFGVWTTLPARRQTDTTVAMHLLVGLDWVHACSTCSVTA